MSKTIQEEFPSPEKKKKNFKFKRSSCYARKFSQHSFRCLAVFASRNFIAEPKALKACSVSPLRLSVWAAIPRVKKKNTAEDGTRISTFQGSLVENFLIYEALKTRSQSSVTVQGSIPYSAL